MRKLLALAFLAIALAGGVSAYAWLVHPALACDGGCS